MGLHGPVGGRLGVKMLQRGPSEGGVAEGVSHFVGRGPWDSRLPYPPEMEQGDDGGVAGGGQAAEVGEHHSDPQQLRGAEASGAYALTGGSYG